MQNSCTLNSFPVEMGKTMPTKRLPWSVLKFGKHFRFYLGGKGTHQQKMWCILKHVCIHTQTYTELTQYNAWSTWKQCFRETTQSIICISIEGEKIRKTHAFHYFPIVFTTKIHGLWSVQKTIIPSLPLLCTDCEFHTRHTLSQEIVCTNLCWWVSQYFTAKSHSMCCK